MYYHFKIHRDPDGLWAECIELEGCVTQGDNDAHLKEMMCEALNLHLDEPEDSDIVFPLPDPDLQGEDIVEVSVEPRIAQKVKLNNRQPM